MAYVIYLLCNAALIFIVQKQKRSNCKGTHNVCTFPVYNCLQNIQVSLGKGAVKQTLSSGMYSIHLKHTPWMATSQK